MVLCPKNKIVELFQTVMKDVRVNLKKNFKTKTLYLFLTIVDYFKKFL